MSKRKSVHSRGYVSSTYVAAAPIKFYPFPWKISFEGIVDSFGEKVIDCKPEIAKIIVEAVNKQNMPISKRRRKIKG